MLIIRLVLAFPIVLFISCSRNATPPAVAPGPTTETVEQQADSQTTTASAQPMAKPVTDADTNAVLDQLSFALRKYCVENRRVPKTFDEFAAMGVVQIPPAPAGKKYSLEPHNLRVILINR